MAQSILIKNNQGYITLLSVMIIGAVGLALTISIMASSISASGISIVNDKSLKALALAESCAEEALEKIRLTPAFVGINTLSLSTGTCDYEILDLGGDNREIRAVGNQDNVVKRVRVIIDAITPIINTVEWSHVADF